MEIEILIRYKTDRKNNIVNMLKYLMELVMLTDTYIVLSLKISDKTLVKLDMQ